MLNAIIAGFARMAAQWVIAQMIMLFASKAGQGAAVAAAVPAAAAATALWAGPATLATIATYGSSAAIAPGLITASAGVTSGMMSAFQGAASAAAVGGGGFKEGGYTGDGNPNQVAGFVHKGEFVIPAPMVQAIGLDRLQPLADGMMALGGLGPRAMRSAAPVNMRTTPNVNVTTAAPQVQVMVFDDRQALKQAVESGALDGAMIKLINRNNLNLGMQT